jgi:hypothetical protein
MTLESLMKGIVIGSLSSLPGSGRRIGSRILGFGFWTGLKSREIVWLNSAAIVNQLSRRYPRYGKSLCDSVTAGGELISHPSRERTRQRRTMCGRPGARAAAPRGLRG